MDDQIRLGPAGDAEARLGLSQAECATVLGVAVETFRIWDAGRRPSPEAIVSQARTLEAKPSPHDRVPLQVLADELHVHVRTLRAAAHDGRLGATFGPRPFFGRLSPISSVPVETRHGDRPRGSRSPDDVEPSSRGPRDDDPQVFRLHEARSTASPPGGGTERRRDSAHET